MRGFVRTAAVVAIAVIGVGMMPLSATANDEIVPWITVDPVSIPLVGCAVGTATLHIGSAAEAQFDVDVGPTIHVGSGGDVSSDTTIDFEECHGHEFAGPVTATLSVTWRRPGEVLLIRQISSTHVTLNADVTAPALVLPSETIERPSGCSTVAIPMAQLNVLKDERWKYALEMQMPHSTEWWAVGAKSGTGPIAESESITFCHGQFEGIYVLRATYTISAYSLYDSADTIRAATTFGAITLPPMATRPSSVKPPAKVSISAHRTQSRLVVSGVTKVGGKFASVTIEVQRQGRLTWSTVKQFRSTARGLYSVVLKSTQEHEYRVVVHRSAQSQGYKSRLVVA